MRGEHFEFDASPAPRSRVGDSMRPAGASLDLVNAALQEAAALDSLASRSEAAFCQAGVVAPPDSLTGETRCDSGEGF